MSGGFLDDSGRHDEVWQPWDEPPEPAPCEWEPCDPPHEEELAGWCLHQGRYYAFTGKDNRVYQMPESWQPPPKEDQ